jgi:hypothetical protein
MGSLTRKSPRIFLRLSPLEEGISEELGLKVLGHLIPQQLRCEILRGVFLRV